MIQSVMEQREYDSRPKDVSIQTETKCTTENAVQTEGPGPSPTVVTSSRQTQTQGKKMRSLGVLLFLESCLWPRNFTPDCNFKAANIKWVCLKIIKGGMIL